MLRQVGVFTGSVLILCVAYLFVRWMRADTRASLMGAGVIWLALTLVFELGLGHSVFGRSWRDLFSDYDISRGGLLPIGLIVLTFSPLIAARLRVPQQPPK